MRIALKFFICVAGIYLLLMLVTGLAAKMLLSGARVKTLLAALESRLPAQVSAAGGDFNLAQWFLFRPAVTIQNLSIANPPGFSSQPLLEAQEVSTQISLPSLFGDRIDIRSFTLHAPQFRVEQDRKGRTNLEALFTALFKENAGSGAGRSSVGALSIRGFSLKSGTIRFWESGKKEPSLVVRDIDLSLADFAADKSCQVTLQARPFGGKASQLDFKGRAGPFLPESLPAQGELSVKLAPAEIPPALRSEYFGDLLREPGDGSRAMLEAAMRGDARGTLRGKGKLVLDDFRLGKDQASRIPLRGQAPLTVTVQKPLTDPSFELLIQDATLQFGEGRWKGRAEVRLTGARLQGGSSGSITGVRIEEMLGAFTSAKGKVSGLAEIPDYRLNFAGRNADEMRHSLSGHGTITLDKGRFALFDLLEAIRRYGKVPGGGEGSAPGQTDFARFKSRFQITDGKVQMSDLALESPLSNVSGQGFFTFDQELNFDLITKVTGHLAGALGGRPDSSGQLQASVPVKVRGTVASPKVYPDVGRLAVEKATGFLDRLLRKKTQEQK